MGKCCRCGSEVQFNPFLGKRACHVTCGPCQYSEDWSRCASCEIVGHCQYALSYLKSLNPNGIKKRCYFKDQITEEETLYHTPAFVDAQKDLIKVSGEEKYLGDLKKANAKSACPRK